MNRTTRIRRSTTVAGLLAATLLSACAPLPWRTLSLSHDEALARERHDVAPPSATGFADANATPARRQATLDRVWRTIDEKYFDADLARRQLPALVARSTKELATVRSDADFYRVLQRNVGAIEDSHTQVMTPREAEFEYTQRATAMGLECDVVEGRVVVTDVVPGFPAAEQGVRRGMIVERIDDQPIDDAFLAAAAVRGEGDANGRDAGDSADDSDDASSRVRRQLDAVGSRLGSDDAAPAVHRVALRRADDSMVEIALRARGGDLPTVESYERLPSGVGVLRLSRFDPSVMPNVAKDLERAAAETRALVVDLRHNPGGAIDAFVDLVDGFIDEPQALARVSLRVWKLPLSFAIDGTPVARPYRGPVAVLVDGDTGSAAELAAHALAELRGAVVAGTPTCGCVVGLLREFLLPDGGVLHVAEVGITSPRGRRMEHDPLRPTLPVTPTLAELRSGDDVVLQAAVRALPVADAAGEPAR